MWWLKVLDFGTKGLSGIEFQIDHLAAVLILGQLLTSLCFSFIICKLGITIVVTTLGLKIKLVNIVTYLEHSKPSGATGENFSKQ